MTLEEHARAIEATIHAAADDGFYLDDGSGFPTRNLDLNVLDERRNSSDWAALDLPSNPMN